jgi:hypothetical protein
MKKTVWITAFCSFLLFLAVGYYLTLRMGEQDLQNKTVYAESTAGTKQVITKNTKLICRYFYTLDRVTKEYMETAPAYLHGLNMEQLSDIYKDWEIIRFSSERVIMRTVIEGMSTEVYLIGETEGKIAVYLDDPEKGPILKEKTDIPLSVLPEEEIEKIRAGIQVIGEESLVKILSDYSS